jgi:hypothetical protein
VSATKTDQPVAIGDLVAAAHRADQAAADAWSAVREAERRNAALQAERVRQVWQTWADGYNPDRLRQAVVDARTALDRAAVAGDPAGPALVAYAAAMLREQSAHRLAVEAQAASATLPATVPAGLAGQHLRDHRGRILAGGPASEHGPLADHLGADAITRAAIAEAERQVQAEQAQVRATIEAARQSVDRPEPCGYEVTVTGARTGETFTAHGVTFTRGVARLPADHPQLAHYRRHPDTYALEPRFAGTAI